MGRTKPALVAVAVLMLVAALVLVAVRGARFCQSCDGRGH